MASYTDRPWLVRLLLAAGGVIAVSCFIFPFSFTFFPSQNTKNISAALGVVWLGLKVIRNATSSQEMQKDLIAVLIAALGVSLISFVAVTYNSTSDYTYVTYVETAIIWLFAAYFATNVIRSIHGYLSVSLLTQYLTAVCVIQCIFALLFDNIPAMVDFFGRFIVGMSTYLKDSGRMFGIGCMLDVAGVRFSAMLALIAQYCVEASRFDEKRKLTFGVFSFLFITLVGNMIARTTLVGVAVAFGIWGIQSVRSILSGMRGMGRLWRNMALILVIVLPILVYLYNTSEKMYENLRFGFEGFFSLVETGHWQTGSNDHLMTMVVWPDNIKTWVIGDGYFSDPGYSDPLLQQLGIHFDVFYMSTDIGYCRFIFYFGLIGLAVMIGYFLISAFICCRRCPKWRTAFFFAFLVNLIVWAKVATDAFPVLALALMIGSAENRRAEIQAAILREDEDELEYYSEDEIKEVLESLEEEQ